MRDAYVIVTDADMDKLTRVVQAFRHSLFRDQRQLDLLDQTLAGAEVRPADRVPRDVVTMNSWVRVFDFDTRCRGLYTLTFPEEANISRGMISVLAPLGIALLGRRRGDVIQAQVPGGARRLRVEGVRQQANVKGAKPPQSSATGRAGHLGRTHEVRLAG